MTQFTTLQTELTKLRARWEAEFPGTSATVELLRESLIASAAVANHSRAAFHKFHLAAESTGLPLGLWAPKFLKQFNTLKNQQCRDMRHCVQTLQSLQSACTQHKAAEAKKPPPPPPPKLRQYNIIHEQLIDVSMVDGRVITATDRPAAFWLGLVASLWDAAYFTRRFFFQDAIVPSPYSYLLTHQGQTFLPAYQITVSYSPDEFRRLCELEQSTGSAHLLDGNRIENSYERNEREVPK